MARIIEKYEIVEEIGHGGMATVYRARDTILDRLVALKVMHPHLRGSGEARARFRREARGVARLKHPFVLEIYDCSSEESEESFIVTELLTGPTLKRFADAHSDMPAEIAASFTIEVCAALAAAHEKGIVHRDVKPENILVHENACVKLTDFGIADMLDAQTMTATGQILGSPGHMAPEQVEGRQCDARSDVFSLGTVLYFLACGELPFAGRNPHQILKKIADGDYTDPLRVRPSIGGELQRIIRRSLALAPQDRFATAGEFEAALRAFVGATQDEKPEELVREYLSAPDATASRVKERVVAHSLGLAARALEERNHSSAQESLNRVLALDEDNREALALASHADRDRSRRRMLSYVVLSAVLLGALSFGIVRWTPSSSPLEASEDTDAPSSDDAGVGLEAGDAPAEVIPTTDPEDPDVSDSSVRSSARPPRPRTEEPNSLGPPTSTPRRVVFDFDPDSVRIAIDGAPPRQWGPNYLFTELTPGRHQFEVESECCVAHFSESIPEGTGDYTLTRTLPNRPAMLIVETDGQPAAVEVGDGLARGFANQTVRVPIESRDHEEELDIDVIAEGHEPFSTRASLRAGTVVSVPVRLVRLQQQP